MYKQINILSSVTFKMRLIQMTCQTREQLKKRKTTIKL